MLHNFIILGGTWQGGGSSVKSRRISQGIYCLSGLACKCQAPLAATVRLFWGQAIFARQTAATKSMSFALLEQEVDHKSLKFFLKSLF